MGTTVRVASIRDDGHTFHDSLTPINVQRRTVTTSSEMRKSRGLTVSLLDVLEIHDWDF